MGAPQIILIVLMTMGVTSSIWQHGKTQAVSFPRTVFSAAVCTTLLWWGGFFG